MEEFAAAGLGPDDVSLINFMANQEVGHSTLLSNILSYGGRKGAARCEYQYDFNTVRDFVNFCQRLTRWFVLRCELSDACSSHVGASLVSMDSSPISTLVHRLSSSYSPLLPRLDSR